MSRTLPPVPGPTALITGVSGQDGVYLARLLRGRGARVVGIVEPGGAATPQSDVYQDGIEVREVDVRDRAAVHAVVAEVAPHEIYNLAAISSVARSWAEPELTHAVNATAVQHLVDAALALRDRTGAEPRLVQASSVEVRGGGAESPYAQAKAAAEEIVRIARDDHGLHASCAILANHESPLRPVTFVTRKIARAVAEIAAGLRDVVTLGNLDVKRDWGFAGDHVAAMALLACADDPADVPVGTGIARSMTDLVAVAFASVGIDDPSSHVALDPGLFRPVDAAVVVADPEPAERLLGWRAKTSFEEVVRHMVAVDVERIRSGVEDSVDYLYPRP